MARRRAAPESRLCGVVRNRTLPADGHKTLFFTIHGLALRARFASPEQVPKFDGEETHFEVERKATSKLGFVFVREVLHPARRIGW